MAEVASAMPAARPELCEGWVMHRRLHPRGHAFRYRVFYLRLPLSQLDALPARGLPRGRFRLVSFDPDDHGGRDGTALMTWAREALARVGMTLPAGEIVLQTFPRMLGYVFNPISQWFVFDGDAALRAVICEVNNTFGERHHYVVAHPDGRPIADRDVLTARKLLHVSPFCAVKGYYRFRFSRRDGQWTTVIDYHEGVGEGADDRSVGGVPGRGDSSDRVIATLITGTARPLDARTLRRAFFRYPLFTLGVIARIHWQAFRLWCKRVPWNPKPPPPLETLS